MTIIDVISDLTSLQQVVLGVPLGFASRWIVERIADVLRAAVRYMTRFE